MPSQLSRRRQRRELFAARRLVFGVLLACGVAACSPRQPSPNLTFEPDRAAAPIPLGADSDLGRIGSLSQTVSISERSAPARRPSLLDPQLEASPFELGHPTVDRFIVYYSDQSPEIIETSLVRAQPHLGEMKQTLRDAGVPGEMVYLPIVESHYKDSAHSRAGAAGIWQLMPPIAKHFGLRVEPCVDERRDPVRSTEAAAQYLSSLHGRFEDWHLALAAYNLGEGRISRIMRDYGVEDYWTMVDRSLLPRETAQFVPKFLAAATVAQNADSFGIDLTPKASLPRDVEPVHVPDPVSLKTVASLAGVDRATVERLNPSLYCGRVPVGGYEVWLPRRSVRAFQQAYADFDRKAAVAGSTHRVRRGESPASIARLYGVSVRALMRENGIHNPRRLRVNTTLRIPEPI